MTEPTTSGLSPAVERRTFTLGELEVRDESGAGDEFATLRGHAALFESLSDDLGGFREIISAGAFRRAIDTSTVHALVSHNPEKPLASTDSGSLRLWESELGLAFWARSPKTVSYVRDLLAMARAGIVRGMSFAFRMPDDGSGEDWTKLEDGTPLRRLERVAELIDISPVTRGAYTAPIFSMRALDLARDLRGQPSTGDDKPVGADEPRADEHAAGDDSDIAPGERAAGVEQGRRLVALRARGRVALAELDSRSR